MASKKKNNRANAWSAEDRQAFADRNILKAQQIPDKRKVADKKACRDFRWER